MREVIGGDRPGERPAASWLGCVHKRPQVSIGIRFHGYPFPWVSGGERAVIGVEPGPSHRPVDPCRREILAKGSFRGYRPIAPLDGDRA